MIKHKLIIFFTFGLIALSCTEKRIRTPKAFLNTVERDTDSYVKDKDVLARQIREFMTKHEQSFYSAEYYDSTTLQIDSILYNNDHQKVIVFVLTKNPIHRQLMPAKNYNWYYNAFCYLGIRQKDEFKLEWMDSFNIINFYDGEKASEAIKDMYFTQFATIREVNGEYKYKYNFDDTRFWSDPIWEKYFENNE
ncbi:hypothetical protein SAMN04488128_105531 [Chitinophaga eiseniae]|uniref:Uncharacterized protein n=1 Tax=Chitinophaga eiseniae TaxID=634771 RepID=A0A1T4TNE4_9BACT|nr:hypothetical protein [Chitinophaga eiseniae]SKA41851.1 hypothetical protein SAMN04488128_105531 [Chitinophaga eiseniae]